MFCFSLWLLSADVFGFYRRINGPNHWCYWQLLQCYGALMLLPLLLLVNSLLCCILYAARTMLFPRLFIRVHNFAHISLLSKLYFVCKCVCAHRTHNRNLHTHPFFSFAQKKYQIKTDFLSIQTRTNKRLAGFPLYIALYRFCFFSSFILYICCDNAVQFFCYVCACMYYVIFENELRLFLSKEIQDVFYTYIKHSLAHTHGIQTSNIVYSRS